MASSTSSTTQTPFTLHKHSPTDLGLSVLDPIACESSAEQQCCVCFGSISEKKITWFQHKSGETPHYIDQQCLDTYFKSKQNEKTPLCPLCRVPISYPYSIGTKVEKALQRIFEKSLEAHPIQQLAIANQEFANLSEEEISHALEREETLFKRCDLVIRRQFWQHAIMAAIVCGNPSLLEKAMTKIPQSQQTLLITNVFLSTVISASYEFAPQFFAQQEDLLPQVLQPEAQVLQPEVGSPQLLQIEAKVAELITSFSTFPSKVSDLFSSFPEGFGKLEELVSLVENLPSTLPLPSRVQVLINLVYFSKELVPTFNSDPTSPIFRPIQQDPDKILENFFALGLLNNTTPSLSLTGLALASIFDIHLAKKIMSVLDMATVSSTSIHASFLNRPFTCYSYPQVRPLFPEKFSPLHIAALRGSLDLFQTMLEAGATLEEANATSDLLGLAFLSRFWNPQGSKELVGFLLSQRSITTDKYTLLGALPTKEQSWIEQVYAKTSAEDIEDALIETIQSGDFSGLQALTSLGADPTQIGKSGGSSAIRRALSLRSSSKQQIVSHLIECFKGTPIPEEDIADMLTVAIGNVVEFWLWDLIEKHASTGLACFNTADSEGDFPLIRFLNIYHLFSTTPRPIPEDMPVPQPVYDTPVATPGNAEAERQPKLDANSLLRMLINKGADPSLDTPSIFVKALKRSLDEVAFVRTPIQALQILLDTNKIRVDFAVFEEIFRGNTPIPIETLELLLNYSADGVIDGFNAQGFSLIHLIYQGIAQVTSPDFADLLELLLKRGVPCSIRALAMQGTVPSVAQAVGIAIIKSKIWIKSWFGK